MKLDMTYNVSRNTKYFHCFRLRQNQSGMVIPYTQGLFQSIKKTQTHFKGNSTIKNLLVSPKDKDPMVNKGGTIYWFQCGVLTCDYEYMGETPRTFGERFKEHLKDPSPIHPHSNNTGRPTSQQNFQIIGREGCGLARNIKESIFIRINNPTLNRNIGKFNLPHIWDRVLLNTPGLTLKRHAQAVGHANSHSPHLNQPNLPTHLGKPNSSTQFSQVLSMLIQPLRTHIRCSFSVLPQT